MKFNIGYSFWPLNRQLQVTFTIATIFLTLILVIITKFQLDWLYNYMIANSHPVLENHVLDQMKNLGYVQQSYIQQQFANYIYIVQTLHDLDSKVLGLNPNNPSPFDVGIPLSSSQIPLNYLNYSQAAYFAANGLSTLGTELVLNNSAIDPIFPLMRHPTILHLYMGFITDGILYSYPGHEITNPAYTPIVRE